MLMNKVVLAYSGGLDTTYCALYLSRELGLEVHAVTVQTGGFSPEELQSIAQRALSLGVASFQVLDETQAYYRECLRYLIMGNVLKNATYPLSVSAERMVQATAIARFAASLGANYVAHGSTGAGNDQVRFDLVFQSMLPGVRILTPIRDQRLSREAEIEFLQQHGVEINAEKARYSINQGLWGTSVGGRETLGSRQPLPEEAWPTPITKTGTEEVCLHFHKGELCGLNNETGLDPVSVIRRLQAIAQPYGIGRDIHVGDTIIGIKGRVGFEAAAPLIIIKAHHLLEKHTLTKWQQHWKEQLAGWYGSSLHEGLMHEPAMRHAERFLEDTQQTVSGRVYISLMPHHFRLNGIESEHDLMHSRFGAYGEEASHWSGEDVRGFARIFGNQQAIFHSVNAQNQEA